MQSRFSRRAWLGRAAAAGVGLSMFPKLTAAEGLPRKEAARMKLSLAAYSFRDFFKDSDHRRAGDTTPANAMDMLGFVDYCAEHHCDGAEVTSYYFPKNTDKEYLLKLKRHAFLRGVALSGGAIGNNFVLPQGPEREKELNLLKKWVDYCEILGAPHIRVFAGTKPKDMAMDVALK